MNRLVYLYELDSTISSEEGVKAGRDALLEETLVRGNRVVITFNQLVDSYAIVGLLQDEKTYEQMISMFKNGSIKVVQFYRKGELIRTAAQYILTAFKAGNFKFGAIPIPENDPQAIERFCKAIKYSDPSLVTGTPELLRYVNVILEISKNSTCYIKGKNDKWEFQDILHNIMVKENEYKKALSELSEAEQDTYTQAMIVLKNVKKNIELDKYNTRSSWVRALDQEKNGDVQDVNLARYIIDLCYNYAVEDSIENISKRYTDKGISFDHDYMEQIDYYFKNSERVALSKKKGNHLEPGKWTKVKLTTAVHVLDMAQDMRKKDKTVEMSSHIEYKTEQFKWQMLRGRFILKSMLMAFVYAVAFYGISQFSGLVEGWLKNSVESVVSIFSRAAISAIITTISFAVVMSIYEMLKKTILKKFKLNIKIPDFAESFFILIKGLRDIFVMVLYYVERKCARKGSCICMTKQH